MTADRTEEVKRRPRPGPGRRHRDPDERELHTQQEPTRSSELDHGNGSRWSEWRWPSPPDPGDLSKRVARRRGELHLSKAQVAARAGMSLRYLEYVERYPARPPAAALRRLAAALQTTPAALLGARSQVPAGYGRMAGPPVKEDYDAPQLSSHPRHRGVRRRGAAGRGRRAAAVGVRLRAQLGDQPAGRP
ncbi:MAG TPA: helix-turn-helix domain-containing protein, partial [Streptosporangiaceae bacterium]|nr:helix-turn-helix domain-containing protein [Streptosporangiaceae bacterium]